MQVGAHTARSESRRTHCGSRPAVRLSDISVQGGQYSARITPEGRTVVFAAAPNGGFLFGLFAVPIDGSAPPVRLDAPSGANYNLNYGKVELSPTGATVYYLASQNGAQELYSVPIQGGVPPTRVNAPLVAGGNVVDFKVGPGTGEVLYRADQDQDDVFELYLSEMYGSSTVPNHGTPSSPPGPGTRTVHVP